MRRHLAVVGAVAAVSVVALALLDTGPNVPIVIGLAVAASAAVLLVQHAGGSLAPPPPAIPEVETPTAHPDLRITTLRQALAAGGSDARLAERVYRQLVAVVDDEIHASHGIDRATDRAAARELLEPELFAFVDDPESARQMTVRGLERIVTQIERL